MTDDCETWYRVPRSAEECAAHKLANGNLLTSYEGGKRWEPCHRTAAQLADVTPRNFRLVYSTPVGMSPVIGAPGHAYGLARQAPEGWDGRNYATDKAWGQNFGSAGSSVIEARPPAPAPAPEPRTELVPLTKLRGRTLVGETEAVKGWSPANPPGTYIWWPSSGHNHIFPVDVDTGANPPGTYIWWPSSGHNHIFPVDVDTGMVEVLAEEEA